jgi:hypothetical protein
MNHQLLMGVMDRGAYGPEQVDSLSDRQAPRLTCPSDRLTLYIRHHDLGPTVLCVAAIQDGADIRMSQRCQGLTLGSKPPKQSGRLDALAHHLYGYMATI